MVTNLTADLERRVGGLLDRVPGYRGYRAKEDRRDADRRLREHVATLYGQQADRVERIARDLAAKRRLAAIGPVDEAARTLRHLIDRVRTATYGYGGLFGDRDVDAGALDQLRLFDEGLLAGSQELEAPVAALEAAAAADGDLAAPAAALTTAVRALHARFDLRGEVVETGKPAPEESVLRVLQIGPGTADAPHPAYDLALGDALSILGDDALVDARIDVSGASGHDFRLFRLGGGGSGSGGDSAAWLLVPRHAAHGLAHLEPVAPPPVGGETALAGGSYTVAAAGSGDGAVTGIGGESGIRPVRFQRLAGGEGGQPGGAPRAIVLDWQGERQAFAGREVHPNDVEIFGRPPATIN